MFPRLGTITDRLNKGLKAKLNRINVPNCSSSSHAKGTEARTPPARLYKPDLKETTIGIMLGLDHLKQFNDTWP
jgi:hypothetical protein